MIWLASYPRSGNKFVQQILHHVYVHDLRTVYEVPSGNGEIAPTWNGDVGFSGFVKTHEMPWPEDHFPSVYVVRDPRDVVCSYVRYMQHADASFRDKSFRTVVSHIVDDKPYGGWNMHCSEWCGKASIVLKYEDCLSDPLGEVGKVCQLLGISDTEKGRLPEFSGLRESADWYYQKGVSGRWRTELDQDQVSLIEHQNHEMMTKLGYLL